MRLGHSFAAASGLGARDFVALAHRFDAQAGLEPDHMESWMLRLQGGALTPISSLAGWANGLWMSPQGTLWLSHADGRLLTLPYGAQGDAWRPVHFSGVLGGVWGLDDGNVFVWGSEGGRHFVSCWDGERFTSFPMRAQVLAMHGLHPELVVAVGADGLAARWDGARFVELDVPTRKALWSVYVEDEQRMYGCGPRAMLFVGSAERWEPLPDPAFPPHALVVHRGALWLGCGELGLHRYEGGTTHPAHFEVVAQSLAAAGGDVLAIGPLAIATSADLSRITQTSIAAFVEVTVDRPPLFAPFLEEPDEQDDDEDDGLELPDPPFEDDD
jgi:hypothetical protein